MKEATLAFLKDGMHIWLGMKKVRFGAGKYNGFGGRIEQGETPEQAALRELSEETNGVKALAWHKVAENTHIFPSKPEWNFHVHVFLVTKWEGTPTETEEMKPEQFAIKDIPYSKMWHDDIHWLPHVLEGKKFKSEFDMTETEILSKKITFVNNF